ncbi:MAG: hypothetical protein ACLVG5_02190 [Clostridium sp.]
MEDKGTPYLHKDGILQQRIIRLCFTALTLASAGRAGKRPVSMTLSTVREVGHYSVRTMTGNCRTLRNLEDEPGWVQMNTEDRENEPEKGRACGIFPRGYCITRCLPTDRVKTGCNLHDLPVVDQACNELTTVSDPSAIHPSTNTAPAA